MTDPSTDDRLVEQLAATLRELPEDELARALHEPIDPQLRERLFDIMETNRASAPTPVPAANDSGRRWALIGVVLAAAAAVAVVVVGQRESTIEATPQVAVVSLSDYTLALDPGYATERSDTEPVEGKLRYRSNNQFGWTMRPDEDVSAPVSVRVCASHQASGEEVEIDVRSFHEKSETGSVRLEGPVAALGLSPGHWTVAVAVGYPDALGEVDSICRASKSESLHVERFDVELLPD
jgi:anti-sigma-K factor RskA